MGQNYHCKKITTEEKVSSDISSMTIDREGNVIVAGFFYDSLTMGNYLITTNIVNSNNRGLYVAKFNKNDSVLWLKKITERQSMFYQNVGVTSDSSGNIVIAYNFQDSIMINGQIIYSTGGTDELIEKIDWNGNYLWSKVLNGKGNDIISTGGIKTDKFNNIYFTGAYASTTSSNSIDTAIFNSIMLSNIGGDYFLIKCDSDANVLWVKGNNVPHLWAGGQILLLNQTNEEFVIGSLLTGTTVSTFQGHTINLPANATQAYFVARYVNDTITKWVKIFYVTGWSDGINLDRTASVLKNGDIVVYGSYNCISPLVIPGYGSLPANTTFANTDYVTFAICYDTSGNVVWAKTLNGGINGNQSNTAEGIVSAKSGSGFILLSNFTYATESGHDTIFATHSNSNVLLEYMDSLGNNIWHKSIACDVSINAYDMTKFDKDLLLVGYTTSQTIYCDTITQAVNNEPSVFLIRLTEGNAHQNVGIAPVKNKEDLVIYPNPCESKLSVSGIQLSENTKVEVVDLLGRTMNITINSVSIENWQLNTANLPSGVYFIKATDANGKTRNAKFVKE